MRAYRYRSAALRAAAAGFDAAGWLLPVPRRWQRVDLSALRRVAVLRLDHLGDLLLALPALGRLRAALPDAEIHLYTGPWGAELAGLFSAVDAVKVTPAGWFRRPGPRRGAWGDVAALTRSLRDGGYDLSLDLRGDLRHHLAAWAAGVPLRAGHGITGGGFLLTHEAAYRPGAHESDQALAVLEALGLPDRGMPSAPALRLPPAAVAQARALRRALGLGPRFVAVQAASGAAAKRWPVEHWAAWLKGLPRGLDACLLGSAVERDEMEALAKAAAGSGRRVAVAAGALSLPGLAAFIRLSRMMASVDSGPAHLAQALGVPVLSLFSGTNVAAQWAPRGPQVTVLQAQGIICAPCGLSDCPIGNACMRALGPLDAGAAARSLLRPAKGRP
jgi:ADP-heptose:LPS heptosyltransferase